ncbi:hypothetical protein BDQ17DRAFT_1334130 [Cyathus striatus]|nr:hypothetical protein BDQ17DRAFT_1334130 [Cyathus striatus]
MRLPPDFRVHQYPRSEFYDHPGYNQTPRDPNSVTGGETKVPKVYCKRCWTVAWHKAVAQDNKDIQEGHRHQPRADDEIFATLHKSAGDELVICGYAKSPRKRDHNVFTVYVHDASNERKSAENLKKLIYYVKNIIENEWGLTVIALTSNGSGESSKARKDVVKEYPELIGPDCYAYQYQATTFDMMLPLHYSHIQIRPVI